MNKKLIFSAALVFSLGLAGCGNDSNKDEKPKGDSAKQETPVSTDKKDDDKKANVEEHEEGDAIEVYSDDELGISGQSGPMKYSIDQVYLRKVIPKTQEVADVLGVGIGEEAHTIAIHMSGENTSTEDIDFFLANAVIITNTKEQLEPDMRFSKGLEMEYLGQVKREGYNAYILKDSKLEDLKTITIRIDGPVNSKLDKQGEDITQTIEVNK